METVFINGKLQLENGQLTVLDEEQIMAEVRSISKRFVEQDRTVFNLSEQVIRTSQEGVI